MQRASKIRWLAGLVVAVVGVGFYVIQSDEPVASSQEGVTSDPVERKAVEPLALSNEIDRRRPRSVRVEPRSVRVEPRSSSEAPANAAPVQEPGDDEEARRALNGRLFAGLPFDDVDAIIDELGLDRIEGMRQLLVRARALRDAINSGERDDIRESAQSYLRAASELQTVEVKQQYHAILKAYHREHGRPAEEVGDVKDVLIPAFSYAQELARVR